MIECHIDIEIEPAVSCYRIQPDVVREVLESLLHSLGIAERELSVRFISESDIQQLNFHYRNRNQPTDVLSFPQQEWDVPLCMGHDRQFVAFPYPQPLGDIVISLEQAEKNAKNIGHGLDRETCFLLIHSLLHLCGHDHELPEEETLMCEQQQLLLQILQEQNPVPWLNMVTRKKDSA